MLPSNMTEGSVIAGSNEQAEGRVDKEVEERRERWGCAKGSTIPGLYTCSGANYMRSPDCLRVLAFFKGSRQNEAPYSVAVLTFPSPMDRHGRLFGHITTGVPFVRDLRNSGLSSHSKLRDLCLAPTVQPSDPLWQQVNTLSSALHVYSTPVVPFNQSWAETGRHRGSTLLAGSQYVVCAIL